MKSPLDELTTKPHNATCFLCMFTVQITHVFFSLTHTSFYAPKILCHETSAGITFTGVKQLFNTKKHNNAIYIILLMAEERQYFITLGFYVHTTLIRALVLKMF